MCRLLLFVLFFVVFLLFFFFSLILDAFRWVYGSMGRSVGRSVQYEYTVRYYLIASSSLRRCRVAGGGGGAKEGDEHQLHQCNLATG